MTGGCSASCRSVFLNYQSLFAAKISLFLIPGNCRKKPDDLLEFCSARAGKAVNSAKFPVKFPVSPYFHWRNVRKSPQTRGNSRVFQSLRFQDSNQNSISVRKVSRAFLGNGRFAESKSGDWFDPPLRGEGDGIRTVEFLFSVGPKASLSLILSRARCLADALRLLPC